VTRAILVVAMAVSLWPLGVVIAIGTGGSEQAPNSQDAVESSTSGEPNPRESSEAASGSAEGYLARLELQPIVSSGHRLNGDLRAAELRAGEPQPEFAIRAADIERELHHWTAEYGGEASSGDRLVAEKLTALMQALAVLAESPTEGNLVAYDAAIAAFNASIE
jgi:hypothetical protein